jgi:acetyltransferase-like isoleucine patch superfamily enzyme
MEDSERLLTRVLRKLAWLWSWSWMQWAGLSRLGRLATWLATWCAPPHKARTYLAMMSSRGYVARDAVVYHKKLRLGTNVFIDDRVVVFQREHGGLIELGDWVQVFRDTIMETGEGASLSVGAGSSIHPRCSLHANVASIRIGYGVLIGPNCAVYSYDHGMEPAQSIRAQPLTAKGDVEIGDESWLGVGVIVLSGVRIGRGAVIGAGAVVTQDIPEYAIAGGSPAKVLKMRGELSRTHATEARTAWLRS